VSCVDATQDTAPTIDECTENEGYFPSILGGVGNQASGTNASVSGGTGNTASGAESAVSGGTRLFGRRQHRPGAPIRTDELDRTVLRNDDGDAPTQLVRPLPKRQLQLGDLLHLGPLQPLTQAPHTQ
jgi:hypothetical protein